MHGQLPDTIQKFGHRINAGLVVSSVEPTDDGLTIGLTGQLKHDATDPLHDYVVAQVQEHRTGNVQLNCASISFVDSQGLGLLLMLNRLCQTHGGKLSLLAPSESLRALLKLTRFDTLIKIAD